MVWTFEWFIYVLGGGRWGIVQGYVDMGIESKMFTGVLHAVQNRWRSIKPMDDGASAAITGLRGFVTLSRFAMYSLPCGLTLGRCV